MNLLRASLSEQVSFELRFEGRMSFCCVVGREDWCYVTNGGGSGNDVGMMGYDGVEEKRPGCGPEQQYCWVRAMDGEGAVA